MFGFFCYLFGPKGTKTYVWDFGGPVLASSLKISVVNNWWNGYGYKGQCGAA